MIDMNSHMGMQHETNTSFIFLYLGIFVLIIAITGFLRIKKEKEIRYGKEKVQKAVLQEKNKLISRICYSFLGVSTVLLAISLITNISSKNDLETLNYNSSIQVTDDKNYGRGHSNDSVQYEMKIPTSGPHSPHDIKFGFYDIKPSYELLVHNLEHGDIIIYYHPNMDAMNLEKIKYLTHFRKEGSGILAVPNDDIPMNKQVMITAWTKTMELTTFNEESIGTFIYQFINKGPESISVEMRQNGGTM